ncbi:MAG: hypothetical protein ACYTHM_00255 [Planctomycetota bacterium]
MRSLISEFLLNAGWIGAAILFAWLVPPAQAEEKDGWDDNRRFRESDTVLVGVLKGLEASAIPERQRARVGIKQRLFVKSGRVLPKSLVKIYVSLPKPAKAEGEDLKEGSRYFFFLKSERGRFPWQVGEFQPVGDTQGTVPYQSGRFKTLCELIGPYNAPLPPVVLPGEKVENLTVFKRGEEPDVLQKTEAKRRVKVRTALLIEDVDPETPRGGMSFLRFDTNCVRAQTLKVGGRRKAGLSIQSRGQTKVYVYRRKSRNSGFYLERIHEIESYVVDHLFWKDVTTRFEDKGGDQIEGPFYNTVAIRLGWDKTHLRILVEMDTEIRAKAEKIGKPKKGYHFLGHFGMQVEGEETQYLLNICNTPRFTGGKLTSAIPFGTFAKTVGKKKETLHKATDSHVLFEEEGALMEIYIPKAFLGLTGKADLRFWYYDALEEDMSTAMAGKFSFEGEKKEKD